MNGNNTYAERQTVVNFGEEMFEKYCREKQYVLHRVGFDEKAGNVPNFFKLNPMIRNLPDYIVNTPTATFVVNVKGTNCIKKEEMTILTELIACYSSKDAQLLYAFCLKGNELPILVYPEKLIYLYQQSKDEQWNDGKVYRRLNV